MNFAEIIKERVPLCVAVETYTGDRLVKGKMCCPFHNEKTASFTVFPNNTYYCFGCGESGDVIAFTKRFFNINFQQAILRLNSDFGLLLPLMGKIDQKAEIERRRKLKEQLSQAEALKERAEAEYWLWVNRVDFLESKIKQYRPKSYTEQLDIDFVVALHWLGYAEYRLSCAEDERRRVLYGTRNDGSGV